MLTQRDVAEKVAARLPGDTARGFDVTYLSKIENARLAPPSTVAIMALAQVLDTDADNLLALAGKVPPDVGEKLKESPGARAFFRSAVDLDLPEKEWQRLLQEMKKTRKGQMSAFKTCFRCSGTLPLSEFYRHPRMADGHLGKCKACTRADVSANRRARSSHYREYERLRQQRADRRAAKQAYVALHNSRHPQKAIARRAVSNALRDGILLRESCEVCGARAEAHHEDYARPLDVRWLCLAHHRERHREMAQPF